MSEMLPEGEDIRRAIRWISEERTLRPGRTTAELVAEASRRFDLSPKDELALMKFAGRAGE